MRPSFFSYVCTILRVFCTEHSGRQHSHALSWEHRRQTQATTASMQRACDNQLGHNAARRAVSPTVDSIGPLDPLSRIDLGPVSYYCCLLWSVVCDGCNRHRSAVRLLCCPAAIDTGSSKAAVPLSQAAERATVRPQLVLLSFAHDIYVQRTLLLLSLLCCGAT